MITQLSRLREVAIEIARRCAKAKPQSYYADPFEPHEWVLDAIMEASSEVERLREAADRIRRHPMAPEHCPVCEWTNINLMNYGSPEGGPKWMCHGCAARALDQLAAMSAARDEACEFAMQWAAHLRDLHGDPKDRTRIAELRKVGQ